MFWSKETRKDIEMLNSELRKISLIARKRIKREENKEEREAAVKKNKEEILNHKFTQSTYREKIFKKEIIRRVYALICVAAKEGKNGCHENFESIVEECVQDLGLSSHYWSIEDKKRGEDKSVTGAELISVYNIKIQSMFRLGKEIIKEWSKHNKITIRFYIKNWTTWEQRHSNRYVGCYKHTALFAEFKW